jgi:glycerophosphoryl diester phosphodiesterase
MGARAVHPEHALVTTPRMAAWRNKNMLVGVWTVNDPARARVLSTLGVDYIVSDNPGSATAALAKAGQCGCIQRKLGMTRASFGYGTGG